MSEKYESANLILKLYELRREEVMRKARTWFLMEFNPTSLDDLAAVAMSEHSNYYRMVITYWDMACSLVNHGAIDEQMFNDANGEHAAVYAKMEQFVPEAREKYNVPQWLNHLESVVMRIPDAKEKLASYRERLRQAAEMRAGAKAQPLEQQ